MKSSCHQRRQQTNNFLFSFLLMSLLWKQASGAHEASIKTGKENH